MSKLDSVLKLSKPLMVYNVEVEDSKVLVEY
jgi:hypothetical protein